MRIGIETSADARQSRLRDGFADGRPPDGAATARGLLASISQMWRAAVSGQEDSTPPTAEAVNVAGLRGSNKDCVTPADGDDNSTPSDASKEPTDSYRSVSQL